MSVPAPILCALVVAAVCVYALFAVVRSARTTAVDQIVVEPIGASDLAAYAAATAQLERAAKRMRDAEATAEAAIGRAQTDAARAALTRLDAEILHTRALLHLSQLAPDRDGAENAAFFEPPRACADRCRFACASLAEEQIECLRLAHRCLLLCRRERAAYRPAVDVATRDLVPPLPATAWVAVNARLLRDVHDRVAARLSAVAKRRDGAKLVVRLPLDVRAPASALPCPVDFETTTAISDRVDVALLLDGEACGDAKRCVALWRNGSDGGDSKLLMASESWPPCSETAPELRKLHVPTWRSSFDPLSSASWSRAEWAGRRGVFVACGACVDAEVLRALAAHVALRSDGACRCGGVDLGDVVDVSSSHRASNAAFFVVFGTEQLFAAFGAGAVPVVFPIFGAEDTSALPGRAVVAADDFASTDTLGRFLALAERDEALWGSFQAWRNDIAQQEQIYSLFQFAAVSVACRLALLASGGGVEDPVRVDEWPSAACS